MTYKATGTKNSSGQDVQEPAAPLGVKNFGHAKAPPVNIIQKRPSYVLVNGQSATAYTFLFETTCSLGGTTGETQTTVLDLQAAGNAPVRLDINPVAWAGGGAATGEVTFVYRGKE